MSKQTEAMKLAQDWYDSGHEDPDEFTEMIKQVIALADQPAQQWTDETAKVPDHVWDGMWKALEQKRKIDSALDRMAENARELGLDYEPPCKTGSQCTSKCPQCDEPAQDNTYGYAKNLAEAIFKQHFASDEHYASGRIVWGVNDTVIGILTQIDNMVADMVRRPAQQQEPVAAIRALTNQCAALIQERDELQKQVWRYEKNGVTCQTYRHKIDRTCSECNVQEDYTSSQPAQQQEPVAYDKTEINCFAQDLYDQKMREGKRGHYESMFHVIHQCIKKVSPPASKPWVGLTDEDLAGCDDEELKQARYWEAKLKEKNT